MRHDAPEPKFAAGLPACRCNEATSMALRFSGCRTRDRGGTACRRVEFTAEMPSCPVPSACSRKCAWHGDLCRFWRGRNDYKPLIAFVTLEQSKRLMTIARKTEWCRRHNAMRRMDLWRECQCNEPNLIQTKPADSRTNAFTAQVTCYGAETCDGSRDRQTWHRMPAGQRDAGTAVKSARSRGPVADGVSVVSRRHAPQSRSTAPCGAVHEYPAMSSRSSCIRIPGGAYGVQGTRWPDDVCDGARAQETAGMVPVRPRYGLRNFNAINFGFQWSGAPGRCSLLWSQCHRCGFVTSTPRNP